jgi:hypothetical protein
MMPIWPRISNLMSGYSDGEDMMLVLGGDGWKRRGDLQCAGKSWTGYERSGLIAGLEQRCLVVQ